MSEWIMAGLSTTGEWIMPGLWVLPFVLVFSYAQKGIQRRKKWALEQGSKLGCLASAELWVDAIIAVFLLFIGSFFPVVFPCILLVSLGGDLKDFAAALSDMWDSKLFLSVGLGSILLLSIGFRFLVRLNRVPTTDNQGSSTDMNQPLEG